MFQRKGSHSRQSSCFLGFFIVVSSPLISKWKVPPADWASQSPKLQGSSQHPWRAHGTGAKPKLRGNPTLEPPPECNHRQTSRLKGLLFLGKEERTRGAGLEVPQPGLWVMFVTQLWLASVHVLAPLGDSAQPSSNFTHYAHLEDSWDTGQGNRATEELLRVPILFFFQEGKLFLGGLTAGKK